MRRVRRYIRYPVAAMAAVYLVRRAVAHRNGLFVPTDFSTSLGTGELNALHGRQTRTEERQANWG